MVADGLFQGYRLFNVYPEIDAMPISGVDWPMRSTIFELKNATQLRIAGAGHGSAAVQKYFAFIDGHYLVSGCPVRFFGF